MASQTYPKPLLDAHITADIVVFTIKANALQIILVERTNEPFRGQLALPGGFLWQAETSLQAAARILAGKAGVKDVYIEQLYTFDSPRRDPRGHTISISYYALVPEYELATHLAANAEQPTLVPASNVPRLAFDHNEIVTYAIERLRAKVGYSNAIYSLLPVTFTFSQLQTAYEIVLGMKLDKRNFRKKYQALGLIESTSAKLAGTQYRPPELFRFTSRQPEQLPSPFL